MTDEYGFEPEGIFPALPTAINEDGSINYEAQQNHIEYLEEGGVHGIVPAGCTGHAATLGDQSDEELYSEHVRYVTEVADMTDLPVIAGDGMNSTQQTIDLATAVEEEADIDAHLMISPYQNCPPQDLLVNHYREVAEAVEKDVIAYNVPGRTGKNIEPRTLEYIADIRGVIGMKEASNDPDQINDMGERVFGHEEFYLGSGDDARNDQVFDEGGSFAISVSANVHPEAVVEVWEEGYQNENIETAEQLNRELQPLNEAMFQHGEKNPISVQYAINQLGYDFGTPRDPIGREPLEGYEETHGEVFTNQTEIENVLDHFGLVED